MLGPRSVSLILLLAAIIAGGGWWLRREETRVLQEQVGLLKVDQQKLAQVRAENARLKAAQVSAEELARLRDDRAAVQRLRRELRGLRSSIAAAEAVAAARPVLTLGEWANVGTATPAATLQTAFAAAAHGDLEGMLRVLDFDPDAVAAAKRVYDAAPADMQVQYRSPERMIAASLANQLPRGSFQVLDEQVRDDGQRVIVARLTNAEGTAREMPFLFRHTADGWRAVVVRRSVEIYAPKLAGAESDR
jgi:hypothetical protein